MALLLVCGYAWADDAQVNYTEFLDVGAGSEQFTDHEDADPFKGWFKLIVAKNCSDEPWGDFHFQLPADKSVIFSPDLDPWSSLGVGNYTWEISSDSKQLDMYFYDHPVDTNEWAAFWVWTDNTSSHHPLFRINYYPTPVPEPFTGSLILVGAAGLLLKKRRARQ